MNKGTGLGLATVFGVVKQSGGSIWVYSEPDHGTTFKLYFPSTDEDAIPNQHPSVHPSSKGDETILVVEDDKQVRDVIGTILASQGYRVLSAPDAAQAISICQEFTQAIDLVLTDVVMPGMSGRDLADRILERRPMTKVLFMSGYTDNTIVHHGVLDAGIAFLQKPITPESLTRKVRGVLDED